MTSERHPLTIAAVLTVTALIAACGSDDAGTGENADTADTSSTADDAALTTQYPLTIDNCGTEIVIDAAPQNAVVLDTSLAETLVALGVVDTGTYDQLLQSNGPFAHLVTPTLQNERDIIT